MVGRRVVEVVSLSFSLSLSLSLRLLEARDDECWVGMVVAFSGGVVGAVVLVEEVVMKGG